MSNIPEECHNTLHIRRSVKDTGDTYDVVYELRFKDTPLNACKCKVAKDKFSREILAEEFDAPMKKKLLAAVKIIDVQYDNTDELK